MKTILAALASAMLLGASACSSTQIHTGALDTAPYAQFHTYAFAPLNGGVVGYRATTRSAHVVDLMKPAVGDVLEQKGYAPASSESDADLIIVCSAGRRDSEKTIKIPWRMTELTGEQFEDRDFVEGGLVIDIFDKSGGQVWHGAGQTVIDPSKPNDERVRTIASKIMSTFPSRTK